MNLLIARETAWMLGFKTKCKNQKIILAGGVLDRVAFYHMPAQRSADKVTLSFYVTRALSKRLRKMAKILNSTITDVVVMLLTQGTSNIELTEEDYAQIAIETGNAKRAGSTKRKSPKGHQGSPEKGREKPA